MARRFYDSNLVNQRWYCELPPKFKALYMHLLCICDNAGFFEVNPVIISAMIGDKIEEEDLYSAFGNRVVQVNEGKGVLADFVYFQCGGELREGCRPHDAIIARLKQNGLSVEQLQSICTHDLKFKKNTNVDEIVQRMDARLIRHPDVPTISGLTKTQAQVEEEEIERLFLSMFWPAYPRKDGKAACLKKWSVILRKMKREEREPFAVKVTEAVVRMSKSEQWQKDGGKFIPMPLTYLNQERWEDEGVPSEAEAKADRTNDIAQKLIEAMGVMV